MRTAMSRKKIENRARTPTSSQGWPLLPKEARTMSTKYVRGLNLEMVLPQPGRLLAGIKTPLTNTTGNFINRASIMTSEGVSVGKADIKTPIAEKQKLARIIPRKSGRNSSRLSPRTAAIMEIGIAERTAPIVIEARISPISISVTDIGIETSLSSVLVLVSIGAITGLIEVAVNQMAIPPRPEINDRGGISLPIKKEKKKKNGSRIPNITTGPFP